MLTCLFLTHRVLQDKASFWAWHPTSQQLSALSRDGGGGTASTESASSQPPTKPHSWGQQAAAALGIGNP